MSSSIHHAPAMSRKRLSGAGRAALALSLTLASSAALASFACDFPGSSFCQDNNLDSAYTPTVCGSSATPLSSCDIVSASRSVTGSCTKGTLLKQTYYGPLWTVSMAQQTCTNIGGVYSAGTGAPLPAPIIGNPSTPMAPPVVDQTTYKVPVGSLPSSAVTTSATGTLGSATVTTTIDLSKALGNQLAAGYNVYLVALIPGRQVGSATDVWYSNSKTSSWKPMAFPLSAFMENVAVNSVDQRLVVNIVSNTNLTALIGAEIYVGYGLSDTEMIESKRFRGVYKIQQ